MEKRTWKVIAVLDSETADNFALKLEAAMNRLEEEGRYVFEPRPVGKHYFVYGRLLSEE